MRVLVTGATGFVGRNFVRRTVAAGHKVRCFVRDLDRAQRILGTGIEAVVGDILDPPSIIKAAEGMEAGVNLVGIVHETEGQTFKRIYVDGTQNLLEALKQAKVRRLIYMSALGAQEKATGPFYRSHWEGEQLVEKSGLDYTIFKPSLIYGPQDRFITVYFHLALWFPIMPVIGSGRSKMQPISVDDVSRACLEALSRDISIGKKYALAGPEVVTPQEMIDAVISVVRKKRLKIFIPRFLLWLGALLMEKLLPAPFYTREHLRMFRQGFIADISPLQTELGVSPLPFEKGIRDFLYLLAR